MVEVKHGPGVIPDRESSERALQKFTLNQGVFERVVMVDSKYWGNIVAVGREQVLATIPLTATNRLPFWSEVQGKCQELSIDIGGIYVRPAIPLI